MWYFLDLDVYAVNLLTCRSLNISVQAVLRIPGFTDNVVTHLIAGLGAGFFAVCIGSPVDVVSSMFLII